MRAAQQAWHLGGAEASAEGCCLAQVGDENIDCPRAILVEVAHVPRKLEEAPRPNPFAAGPGILRLDRLTPIDIEDVGRLDPVLLLDAEAGVLLDHGLRRAHVEGQRGLNTCFVFGLCQTKQRFK